MPAGEAVLNQCLRVLRSCDGRLELLELDFHQLRPRWISTTASREERTNLGERESRILTEPDQGDPSGARRTVVSASAHSPIRCQQPNALVVTQRRGRQARLPTQLANSGKCSVRHPSLLT